MSGRIAFVRIFACFSFYFIKKKFVYFSNIIRQRIMLLRKTGFSFWFQAKKLFRTSSAVRLFVVGLIAAFNYIHAETSALKSAKTAQKTYRNPLLPEIDMADPHVIRVDGKYYLYATSHGKG